MTQKQRLATALINGAELTSKQIRSQFSISSPAKVVSQLRLEDGMSIYLNTRTDSKGRTTQKYRLGTPNRAVIAAGYRAMAMGL
jgi:hypothetical protein